MFLMALLGRSETVSRIKTMKTFMTVIRAVGVTLFFMVFSNVHAKYYEVIGSDGKMVYKADIEHVKPVKQTNFSDIGMSTPEAALGTYLYYSRLGDYKKIVDLHHDKDGSQDFIVDQLINNPSFINGFKKLKSITVKEKIYIGKVVSVLFDLENTDGNSAQLYESFYCENGSCRKTNYLNIFGDSPSTALVNTFFSVEKRDVDSISTNGMSEVRADDPSFGESGKRFSLFLDVKKIDKKHEALDWNKKLSVVGGDEFTNDDKLAFLQSYIPDIFYEWNRLKRVNFRFSRARVDKNWLPTNLAVVDDFKLNSFFETAGYVWVFCSAVNYEGSPTYFVFKYDVEKNLFVAPDRLDSISKVIYSQYLQNAIYSIESSQVNRLSTYSSSIAENDEFKFKHLVK
jgi:hypothetical protein